jgi:Dephospho-CoA kinase
MKLVGLTGGIACGKSLCSEELAQHVPVIDCDRIAHEVMAKVRCLILSAERCFPFSPPRCLNISRCGTRACTCRLYTRTGHFKVAQSSRLHVHVPGLLGRRTATCRLLNGPCHSLQGRWGWRRILSAFKGHDLFQSDGAQICAWLTSPSATLLPACAQHSSVAMHDTSRCRRRTCASLRWTGNFFAAKRSWRLVPVDAHHGAGSIDRDKLGTLVFEDPALRRRLNKATHTPIVAQILRSICHHWLMCRPLVARSPGPEHCTCRWPMCALLPLYARTSHAQPLCTSLAVQKYCHEC